MMRIEKSGSRLLRGSCVVIVFVALTFVLLTILLPGARRSLSVIALWSIGWAVLLNPDISSRVVLGFREFCKASAEVAREIGGDDDDGPHAA
jgi:hypothetical protein